jgi:hypothetical protein
MAHFCELDENNIVKRTIVVDNKKLLNENGDEQEALGIAHCQKLYGSETKWVQTSYNANFRKKYATAGFQYLEEEDIFIASQPFDSWTQVDDYKTTTGLEWEAPIPKPEEEGLWMWDEGRQEWLRYQ